ncbi:hypothetical protein ANAEL_05864 [Anaerolineales bacterium]|nr:hypothetical protein ANAEL_05864 [Anaerolineales bacterium]
MKHKRNVAIALVLSAAAGFLALQNVSAPTPDTAPPTAESIVTEPPVTEASVPEQCAYTWAYQDAPELTQKLDAAVKALNPDASGRAQLFGENCGYADGHSTFGVMETDFYVRSPVNDLTDEEFLGNWVAQIMPIVSKIPREEIKGNYGFVEFSNADGQVFIRVPIQKYMNEAQGKTGAELFRMFSNAP